MLESRAGHVVLRTTDQPVHRDLLVGGLDLDETLGQLRAEQIADPRPPPVGHGEIVHAPAVVIERHRHGRVGQGGAHEGLGGVRPFRRRRTEEGPSGRHFREQLVDLDGRADRTPLRRDVPHHPAVDLEAGAMLPRRSAGADHHPRHLGDRREGLATETERSDPFEVIGDAELAGGVRSDRQGKVLGVDAGAVVHDPHEAHAPLLERDGDPRRTGVECVLEEFLDDARRTFDHLAGSDPVDDRHRQSVNASHGRRSDHRGGAATERVTTGGTP